MESKIINLKMPMALYERFKASMLRKLCASDTEAIRRVIDKELESEITVRGSKNSPDKN